MLGIVAVILVIGAVITLAGVMLLFNLAGAGDFVMRHVTSKYLGSLPPGFANSKRGFRVYSITIISIGVVFLGIWVAASTVALGLVLMAAPIARVVWLRTRPMKRTAAEPVLAEQTELRG